MGNALGVQVVGSVAYVADRNAGLQIFGVGIPSAPVRLGGFDTPGVARAIQVIGNLAYVADDTSGLQILDVSVSATPVRLGSIGTGGGGVGNGKAGLCAQPVDRCGVKLVSCRACIGQKGVDKVRLRQDQAVAQGHLRGVGFIDAQPVPALNGQDAGQPPGARVDPRQVRQAGLQDRGVLHRVGHGPPLTMWPWLLQGTRLRRAASPLG